jgi:hypothetical protein
MAAISGSEPTSSSLLEIPLPGTIKIPDQAVVLVDNGTAPATVALNGVDGRSVSGLVPYLTVKKDSAAGREVDYKIAGKLGIDAVNKVLTATFPNISSLFGGKVPNGAVFSVAPDACPWRPLSDVICPKVDRGEFSAVIVTPPPAAGAKATVATLPSVALPVGIKSVKVTGGMANFGLVVAAKGDVTLLTAKGCTITSATGQVSLSPNFSNTVSLSVTVPAATMAAGNFSFTITDNAQSQVLKVDLAAGG